MRLASSVLEVRAARSRCRRSSTTSRCCPGAERLARPGRVHNEKVAPFAAEFCPPVVQYPAVVVPGLRGEPDDDGRGRIRCGRALRPGRRGCPGWSPARSKPPAVPFWILASATTMGGSRRQRVAMMMTSARAPVCSSRRTTRSHWRSTPARSRRDCRPDVEPATTVISAPRAAATRGQCETLLARTVVAQVAHRVQRLAGPTGADHDPCTGQVREAPRVVEQGGRPTGRSRWVGNRPAPLSRPVNRPESGGMTTTHDGAAWPRCHGSPGAPTSPCASRGEQYRQRAVSREAVSRSSACPLAARASRSAVAGATTTRSASWPRRTCATPVDVVEDGRHRWPERVLERGRTDELQGGGGRDDADVVSSLGVVPDDRARFVGGDSATHADEDALAHRSRHDRAGAVTRPRCARAGRRISRIAIDSGFSWRLGSTSGPTY